MVNGLSGSWNSWTGNSSGQNSTLPRTTKVTPLWHTKCFSSLNVSLYLVIDNVEGQNTDGIHIFLVSSSPKSPVIAECYNKYRGWEMNSFPSFPTICPNQSLITVLFNTNIIIIRRFNNRKIISLSDTDQHEGRQSTWDSWHRASSAPQEEGGSTATPGEYKECISLSAELMRSVQS